MDYSSVLENFPFEDSSVLILHFINPFHEKQVSTKTSFKSVTRLQEYILRLFKTTAKEEYPDPFSSCNINNLDSSFISQSLPEDIKSQVPWLSRRLSKSDNDLFKVSVFEFNLVAISCVLHIIKSIDLRYTLMKSRNGEELFCKVIPSENWLRRRATEMNYRLKLRKNPKKFYEFKKVPPFGPIWLSSKTRKNEDIFVHYNQYSEEVPDKLSLFTFTDKYRIVSKYLSGCLDVHTLKNCNVLISIFAVHEPVPLSDLKNEWANFRKVLEPQPLYKIKNYFSEQIAFYFGWMDTYKKIMKICAVTGFLVSFLQFLVFINAWNEQIHVVLQIFFNLFLSIWGVFFDKYWARREKELAWEWGTLNFIDQEIQREQFRGKFKRDEASGTMKLVRDNQIQDNSLKIISFSSVLVFITLVIIVVISVFQLRVSLITNSEFKDIGAIISGLVYVIQIKLFDVIYSKIAQKLNIWENHETINQHNNSLSFKLFLFQFVNNYSGLFYIAFFKEYFEGCSKNGCMFDLGLQLVIIFIVNFALNLAELGLPWFLFYFRRTREERNFAKGKKDQKQEVDPIETESQLEPYDFAIEDYLEMCIQFGFVALFGASFPLVAAFALFEIVWEIRIDAWKLCYLVRRPEPVKTEEIGIWKNIVVAIAFFGVFTNSGIVIFTSGFFVNSSFKEKWIIFLVLEHSLFFVIWVLKLAIPSYPQIVKQGEKWSKRVIQKKISGECTEVSKFE
jgi:hypothetical protein